MDITVEGWFDETHDERSCRFLCVHTIHYGFSVTQPQVENLVSRLATLLETGQCLTDDESVLHVDWSQGDSESVMIAFRPGDDCQGRYYDFPKEAAAGLLDRLKERLSSTSTGRPSTPQSLSHPVEARVERPGSSGPGAAPVP